MCARTLFVDVLLRTPAGTIGWSALLTGLGIWCSVNWSSTAAWCLPVAAVLIADSAMATWLLWEPSGRRIIAVYATDRKVERVQRGLLILVLLCVQSTHRAMLVWAIACVSAIGTIALLASLRRVTLGSADVVEERLALCARWDRVRSITREHVRWFAGPRHWTAVAPAIGDAIDIPRDQCPSLATRLKEVDCSDWARALQSAHPYRCNQCGYILTGHSAGRCSECGSEIRKTARPA